MSKWNKDLKEKRSVRLKKENERKLKKYSNLTQEGQFEESSQGLQLFLYYSNYLDNNVIYLIIEILTVLQLLSLVHVSLALKLHVHALL